MLKKEHGISKRLLALLLTAAMVFSPGRAVLAADGITPEAEEMVTENVTENVTESITEAGVSEEVSSESEVVPSTEENSAEETTETDAQAPAEGSDAAALQDGAENGTAITPFNEDNIVITSESDSFKYTGSEIKPEFTVKNKNTEAVLVEGTDYTTKFAEFSDNIHPGYIVVEFKGTGTAYSTDIMYQGFEIYFDIPSDSIQVTPGGKTIRVTNNTPVTLYAAVVKTEDLEKLDEEIYITPIDIYNEAGFNTQALSTYIDPGTNRRHNMAANTRYTVFLAASPYFMVTKDAEDQKKQHITVNEITTGESPERASEYKDGSEIQLNAAVQKNQSVKISWKITDKVLKQQYKKFKLYVLEDLSQNDQDETKGWKEIWPKAAAKAGSAVTIKTADAYDLYTGLIRLECYDQAGTEVKANYLGTIAPYVFYVEGGADEKQEEFCFSYLNQNTYISYQLEADSKKTFAENPAGYITPSEGLEVISYTISKTQTAPASRGVLYDDETKLKLGTNYFFRVKTIYQHRDLTLTSGSSNIMSVKKGPSKCSIFSITGADPAQITEATTNAGGIHADSYGTCNTLGYVIFQSQEDPASAAETKQIQLLISDTPYGTYKVLKSYTPKDVSKLTVEVEGATLNLYYVQYNKFPPEEEHYYAVRTVSKTGGAVGGFSDGFYNKTTYEKVQDLFAYDTGNKGIDFFWKHDDCAKFYYIYRYSVDSKESKTPEELEALFKVADEKVKLKKNAPGYDPNYSLVIKGASPKKVSDGYRIEQYSDKKVEIGKKYYYMIRPVYNKAKASASYDEYSYSVTIDTEGVVPTYSEKAPKNLKLEVYDVLTLKLKWAAISGMGKDLTGYRISRISTADYDSAAEETKSDPGKWPVQIDIMKDGTITKKVDGQSTTLPSDKKSFTGCTFNDEAERLSSYYYAVCGLTIDLNNPTGYCDIVKGENKPLPAGSVTASYRSGKAFAEGARVTFSLNDKDMVQLYAHSNDLTFKYRLYATSPGFDGQEKEGVITQKSYSFEDEADLNRGAKRKYTVVITCSDKFGTTVSSDEKTANFYKPTEVWADADEREVKVDEEITFTIKDNGSYAVVLDGSPRSSNDSVLRVVKSETSGGSVRVRVRGVRPGRASIKFSSYRSGWTNGSSSGKLNRSIEFTVKAKDNE
ncbi:MAG: hypothetical protein IJT16_11065 [Lachnospiraceae bacterium]|nr:hypothetical protein [Lachnospiraceae bacterium]